MKKIIIILLILIFLTGLFLLGKGITGNVVSQSCCYPPPCEPEYYCDTIKKAENLNIIKTGTIMAIFSILTYLIIQKMTYKK
jgi:hypothetical protein